MKQISKAELRATNAMLAANARRSTPVMSTVRPNLREVPYRDKYDRDRIRLESMTSRKESRALLQPPPCRCGRNSRAVYVQFVEVMLKKQLPFGEVLEPTGMLRRIVHHRFKLR